MPRARRPSDPKPNRIHPDDWRAYRIGLKMTQAQLADKLDVVKSTVAAYEQGARRIPTYMVMALYWLVKTKGGRYNIRTVSKFDPSDLILRKKL